MKNRIIFLSIAIIAAFFAHSQTHYESNIALGGKGGVTLSRMNFSPTVPQTFLAGTLFGASFRYIEERHFGLIVELNLEQRGWKEKFEGSSLKYNRRLTYIHLPMLTHIYFGSSKVHGFFNLGPEIAYMIGSSTSSNFDYQNWETVADQFPVGRSTDQFNLPVKHKFDYGITAGVGMEIFAANRHSILLEGRFYYGLHDVFGNHATDEFSSSSGMSINVSLGYFFRIK